ncbi:MAG: 50S ribosomal protein L18 [Deltaproteobacteria bacterium]|nr:50S ribosomal protein L18 [Deltaproteobacteria bacterium]
MAKTNHELQKRMRRKASIRKKIAGRADRPRLTVFRSGKHIYAQIVDDDTGHTLVAASTLSAEFRATGAKGSDRAGAAALGESIGHKALEAGIREVVFDRNGYLYHGRIQALADGARKAGLAF